MGNSGFCLIIKLTRKVIFRHSVRFCIDLITIPYFFFFFSFCSINKQTTTTCGTISETPTHNKPVWWQQNVWHHLCKILGNLWFFLMMTSIKWCLWTEASSDFLLKMFSVLILKFQFCFSSMMSFQYLWVQWHWIAVQFHSCMWDF